MIKAIFFDLDGTLINSEEYYLKGMVKIAEDHGYLGKPEEFFEVIGKDMDYTYDYFEKVIGQKKDTWLKDYNDYFKIVNPLNFKELLFDDVIDSFKKIKEKGIKIAICSMSPSEYIKEFIKQSELEEYIDYYISGEDCENNKPAPDIYLKTLKILNIDKDEAIVVEDAKEGILAAKNAGIKVLARDDSRFNIDQSDAYLVFKDLRKLLTIL